jgi:hypothetical protein
MPNHVCQLLVLAALAAVGCSTPTPAPAAVSDTNAGLQSADSSSADAAGDASADTAVPDVAKDVPGKDATAAKCNPYSELNQKCLAGTHCGYDDGDQLDCLKDGTHDAGVDCSDGGGCTVGMCVQAQNGESACAPYCTSGAACYSGSCNKIEGKNYKVCDVTAYTACNPFGTACTVAGQACYDMGSEFVCLKKGTAEKGDLCSASNECAPGLTCSGADKGSQGICRKLCHVKTAAECDSVTANCSQITATIGSCEE